jgi:hypothetical protein
MKFTNIAKLRLSTRVLGEDKCVLRTFMSDFKGSRDLKMLSFDFFVWFNDLEEQRKKKEA